MNLLFTRESNPFGWSLQGIYLFFDSALSLLYVGKPQGKSSCVRMRLNGYFDAAEKRSTGACVLLQEWNGYMRPWAPCLAM
jgi:hypothetical protein